MRLGGRVGGREDLFTVRALSPFKLVGGSSMLSASKDLSEQRGFLTLLLVCLLTDHYWLFV